MNPQNRQEYPCYRLFKREILVLISGYSIELRAKIIDVLNFLEEQKANIQNQQLPACAIEGNGVGYNLSKFNAPSAIIATEIIMKDAA